jgi:MFS family permease
LNIQPKDTAAPTAPAKRSFAAMRYPGFRVQFVTFVFAMMADNIEHVISYWVMFQKFHSPALAGFAIVSHWLPFLLFSVAAGALTDRFDPRRIIQCGMLLFILVSLGWGYFFITDTLQMWQAMVLLVVHGCAGVLWFTPVQVLLYDIVGPVDLMSAVRLNATARYLGVLVGPAAGGFILLALGSSYGIFLNTIFYLPLLLWLVNAPYGPRFRGGAPPPRRAVRGLADITHTVRAIRDHSVIVSMTILAGAASFFVSNAYSSQMPGFAEDLGHAIRDYPTACCWRPMPAALSLPASCSRAADYCRRGSAPPSCSPYSGASRWPAFLCRGTTRSRSACCSPPGSSSCRSTRWRQAWCRSTHRWRTVDASSACSPWQATASAPSAACRSGSLAA